MKARLYFGTVPIAEVEVPDVPAPNGRRPLGAADTVTLALYDAKMRPLFLTGKLESL